MAAGFTERKPAGERATGRVRTSVRVAPELTGAWTAVAVAVVCLGGVTLAAASGLLSGTARIVVYLLANLILTVDVIDLLVRLWVLRVHAARQHGPSVDLGLTEISNAERAATLQPYALIASLHDEADGVDRFLTALSSFKDRVWLIDDASSD